MASKPFQEKVAQKEKELAAAEKTELKDKHDKNEKTEKEHKDQKEHKDTKDQKDQKEVKDKHEKEKHEKEKHEKEHKGEKHEKHEPKEFFKEKDIHKDQLKELETTQLASPAPGAAAAEAIDFAKTGEAVAKLQVEGLQKIPDVGMKFAHQKEKPEKDKHEKEYKLEKFEHDGQFKIVAEGKLVYEGYTNIAPGGDPLSQRIASLEAVVTQLMHFIPENLRPDLSQGALKQEPDVAKQKSADEAKAGGVEGGAKEEKDKGKR